MRLSQLGEVYIFKFTDKLQACFEELLSKNKQDALMLEEQAEIENGAKYEESDRAVKSLLTQN